MNDEIIQKCLLGTIARFDHYYDTVNSKGSVYLALNTFMLGGLAGGFYTFKDTCYSTPLMVWLCAIAMIFCFLSIAATLWALTPYFTKGKGSILYFVDLAKMDSKTYEKILEQLTDRKLNQEMSEQARLLSVGLGKKFNRLFWATVFTALAFAFALGVGFHIIFK